MLSINVAKGIPLILGYFLSWVKRRRLALVARFGGRRFPNQTSAELVKRTNTM